MISSRTTLDELETLYRDAPLLPLPAGRMRGHYLTPLKTPGARRLTVRLINGVGFQLTPFGIDFDTQRWFFFTRFLQAGKFVATTGPSRWRDTEAHRVRYAPSRLPIKHWLYDELKPLADGTVLGLGGLNADRGDGDHFFFLLDPL